MITTDDFKRVKNDLNGNPRYVFHYIHFKGLDYEDAVKVSKKLFGGRKYRGKEYGGYIVITSYNLYHEINLINEFNNK